MRIPYAPKEPADPTPQNQAIYDRIAERRKPRPLIPLDLALLHNPAIADGYNALLGAIRTKSSLSQALAELSICYIAILNGAVYEWTAHAPLALKAGVERDKLRALLDGGKPSWEGWSAEEKDVLEFTEQSTIQVRVDDALFDRIKSRFSDQEVMELTITVAGYNMVSRFLVALDVTESNGKEMEMPAEQ
ncbi:4-carboxymuconolactone decarboxylase family [Lecanosticta acicola]|uniref:4-carboxymuconolactone decarboxylase family n=1 Tax=Lecanosticta acicola TaxID=111012 RepID=A0AAI9E7Q6_9PEZI|nr:4-carboxymuconolactone decarboxylase family [Lecanosticta acicola]